MCHDKQWKRKKDELDFQSKRQEEKYDSFDGIWVFSQQNV